MYIPTEDLTPAELDTLRDIANQTAIEKESVSIEVDGDARVEALEINDNTDEALQDDPDEVEDEAIFLVDGWIWQSWPDAGKLEELEDGDPAHEKLWEECYTEPDVLMDLANDRLGERNTTCWVCWGKEASVGDSPGAYIPITIAVKESNLNASEKWQQHMNRRQREETAATANEQIIKRPARSITNL